MQELFVTVMIAWAVYAVASRYLPRSVRQGIRSGLSTVFARLGWRLPLPAAGGGRKSACGGCDGCDDKPAPGAQVINVEALRRTARRAK